MKVFISQPMNGKTNEEIQQERERAIADLEARRGDKLEVIDSFFEDAPHDATPLWCLGKSIQLLGEADLVVLVGDWQKYRGCKIEYAVAKAYGIQTLEV